MSKFILEIKDKSKEESIINFLKQIPFVSIEERKKNTKRDYTEFKKLFGIWSKKDIDLNELRDRAWRRK